MEPAAAERMLLSHAGTGLVEIGERYWAANRAAPDTYPADAHHSLAQIEETSFWFAHRNRVINAVFERFPPAGPVIDIGGGNGFVSLGMVRRGQSCVVVEPGHDAAGAAHGRGLTVLRAAFDRRLFREGSLAAVGLFDVIEHIADDRSFLADCLAALSPGGYAYITAPAFGWLWSADDDYARHRRRYSRRSLTNAVRGAGFEVCFVSHFFSLLVGPLFFLRTLPSALGLRKVAMARQTVGHHGAGGWLKNVAMAALVFERAAIAGGRALPLGTSLIAVARKRPV